MAKGQKRDNDQRDSIKGLGPSNAKTPPTKKLSSKLLDMKFMQQAQVKEEREVEQKKEEKIKDESHWSLSESSSTKKPAAPKTSAISYAELLDDEQEIVGRRSWGNFNAKPEAEEPADADEAMDELPNNDAKPLKRKSTTSSSQHKKRKKKSL